MFLLSKNPPAAEVWAWCEQWLAHLPKGDFVAAHAMIMPGSQWKWTPELIEALITNCGSLGPDPSGRRYRVTPPDTATGKTYLDSLRIDPNDPIMTGDVHPRFPFCVWWSRKPPLPKVGMVHLNYPLNREWTPLVSAFDILVWEDGLVLDLER